MPKTAAHLDKLGLRPLRTWRGRPCISSGRRGRRSRAIPAAPPARSRRTSAPSSRSSRRRIARRPTSCRASSRSNSAGIPASGYFAGEIRAVRRDDGGDRTRRHWRHPDGASRFTDRWNLSISSTRTARRARSARTSTDMNDFYDQAKALMDAPNINALFSFSTDEHTRYGSSDVRRLARRGAQSRRPRGRGTRFVQATLGGWDHHSGIYDKTAGAVALHPVRAVRSGLRRAA